MQGERSDANSFFFLVHREDDRAQAISERYLQKKRITFKDTFTARRTVKRSGFAVFHLKKKDGVGKQGIKKPINANLPNLKNSRRKERRVEKKG